MMQRLSRSRLRVREAIASVGIGDRRSKERGAGLEFEDHRPYQPGDDIRHLDQHLYARLGEHYTKRFSLYQQLPVTVLLDASGSMGFGRPEKMRFAAQIAGAFAYVSLAGGDRVRVGKFAGERVEWYPTVHGLARANGLLHWLEEHRATGRTSLARTVRLAAPRLRANALLIIVSDFWVDDVADALRLLRVLKQEVLAMHILAPEEVEPERLGLGEFRLLDMEAGHEIEVALDPESFESYRQRMHEWLQELAEMFQSVRGYRVSARSDSSLEDLVFRGWRSQGLIG